MEDTDYEFEQPGKTVPEYLILDISDALRSLVDYLERDYGNKYLNANDFVNGILQAVCTDSPEDSLSEFLNTTYDTLSDEDFEPGDVFDILTAAEMVGSIIVKQFQMLGFYELKGFWGYQIQTWLNPANIVLGYGLNMEFENFFKRIKVYNK